MQLNRVCVFSTGRHRSKIDKYKKISSNMGVIVYCITGKKKHMLSVFRKIQYYRPKTKLRPVSGERKKTDESNLSFACLDFGFISFGCNYPVFHFSPF
jgi:hypothetical protein